MEEVVEDEHQGNHHVSGDDGGGHAQQRDGAGAAPEAGPASDDRHHRFADRIVLGLRRFRRVGHYRGPIVV
ncbi:MAG TPA: hypothetical protein VM367_12430, partial [Pseudonocardia sp.]|nr:hypothetical protein [Pseudonocardia sp.]